MRFRGFVIFLLSRLPGTLRSRALKRLFGFNVHPSARIGFSFIDVERLQMGSRSLIGHLTLIKGLDNLVLEENARIGNLNWVSGFPQADKTFFEYVKHRDPSLYLDLNAAITHRHLVDCTDAVRIGSFSSVGGSRSQLLTHSIDLKAGRQSCKPIEIGSYSQVATGSIVLGGGCLPNRSVLGSGSVLRTAETRDGIFYSGVPAVPITEIVSSEAH